MSSLHCSAFPPYRTWWNWSTARCSCNCIGSYWFREIWNVSQRGQNVILCLQVRHKGLKRHWTPRDSGTPKVGSWLQQGSVGFEHHRPKKRWKSDSCDQKCPHCKCKFTGTVNIAQVVAPPASLCTNTHFLRDALRRTKSWNAFPPPLPLVEGTCWQGNLGGKCSYAIQAMDILCTSNMSSHFQRNSAKKHHCQKLERIQMLGTNLYCWKRGIGRERCSGYQKLLSEVFFISESTEV